jgi:Tol biopolymer transport system component
VSASDSVTVLAELDRPATPRAVFADALLESCLAELGAPARHWPSARPRDRRLRVAVVAVAVFLLLAGVATATYFAVRGPTGASTPPRSQLTVILSTGAGMRVAEIAAIDSAGRLRPLWKCPEKVFCGELTSVGWSPDGKRLALTLDEIGGRSGYVGLHVLNLATGADMQIPSLPIPHISHVQPSSVLDKLRRQAIEQLGCHFPSALAWSPDSKRLAYACTHDELRSRIYVIRADGTGRIAVPTGVPAAFWPTWSPAGKQLAFATHSAPRVTFRTGTTDPVRVLRSSVYVIGLDGSARRFVAGSASAPSWSSDGKIAYESSCGGIRLATVEGVDITPGSASDACRVIGLRGRPAWSPDATAIAIGAPQGVYVVDADGGGLHRTTRDSSMGVLGGGRPAWTPGVGARRLEQLPKGGL